MNTEENWAALPPSAKAAFREAWRYAEAFYGFAHSGGSDQLPTSAGYSFGVGILALRWLLEQRTAEDMAAETESVREAGNRRRAASIQRKVDEAEYNLTGARKTPADKAAATAALLAKISGAKS